MRMCSLTSGSSGNCIYVGNKDTDILVDCGASGKYIKDALDNIGVDIPEAIVITHEHCDHISGLGILQRRYNIPMFMTSDTLRMVRYDSKLGKLNTDLLFEIERDKPFNVGNLEITPFRINHDALEPVAFRISSNNKSVAIATDMGEFDDYTIDNLKGLDAVLLEANHDVRLLEYGSYTYDLKQRIRSSLGHLSNEDSARLLCEIASERLKHVFLGHLSGENNYPILAKNTVIDYLENYREDLDINEINIEVVTKKNISKVVEV